MWEVPTRKIWQSMEISVKPCPHGADFFFFLMLCFLRTFSILFGFLTTWTCWKCYCPQWMYFFKTLLSFLIILTSLCFFAHWGDVDLHALHIFDYFHSFYLSVRGQPHCPSIQMSYPCSSAFSTFSAVLDIIRHYLKHLSCWWILYFLKLRD